MCCRLIPSLMESFLRRIMAGWPVFVQAATWTVLLMFTVAVASFAPEMAFVSTVSSSSAKPCGGDGFSRIPLDFPAESVCVPSHMVKRSSLDVCVPTVFAAVMVAASACVIRSCFGIESGVDRH